MLTPPDYALALSLVDERPQAITDFDLSLQYVNTAFATWFLPDRDDTPRPLAELVDNTTELEALCYRLQEDDSPQTLTLQFSDHLCQVLCQPLTVNGGKYLGLTVLDNLDENTAPGSDLPLQCLRPAPWDAALELAASMLRDIEVTPILMNVVMQLQAPHQHQQRIYIVLAELFSNALEHGLLGLDSEIKTSASGFAQYYHERNKRLHSLDSGHIRISLEHQPVGDGGDLHIRVEDSGTGFDAKTLMHDAQIDEQLSGRGSQIVRQLCDAFYYTHNGCVAHAIYHWDP